MLKFTIDEIHKIKTIIQDNTNIINGKTVFEHILHCSTKMIEISNEFITLNANNSNKIELPYKKTMQYGLSVGRIQELLLGIGGKEAWWDIIKEMFEDITIEKLIQLHQYSVELHTILFN